MQYRILGRTGLRVSVIGLGTMVHAGHFGPMKDSEYFERYRCCVRAGRQFYRHIRHLMGSKYGRVLGNFAGRCTYDKPQPRIRVV